jgi:beta-glucosidase
VGSAADVTYTPTGTDGGRAAAAAAASAQLALICIAAPVAEGTAKGLANQEASERPGLGLAPRDLQLLQSVLAVQPNAVVVVTAPGGVLLPFAPAAAAMLLAFWPGQEWGAALADLLFGATAPSEP